MVADELAALATAGATTLVGAMVTDAWQVARSGIARLFGRRGSGQNEAIGAQLDRNAALVERAPDADKARRGLAAAWDLELGALLAEHPDAAGELKALIAEVHGRLPAAQQSWVQTNIARDHGTVFAVLGGNLVVHQAPPAEPPGAGSPGEGGEDAG
jgi:hypothetical protein